MAHEAPLKNERDRLTMTDKEYAKQKKRVQKYFDKWFDDIGLGWWHVDVAWDRARSEEEPSEAACTSWLWQYRSASITFRLPVVATLDEEKLEHCVVHEFAHILTGSMVQNAPEENAQLAEYGVENVARDAVQPF